jgi:hypothetical protein
MRLVVAGIGVADRGDHSMINSDLITSGPWP